MQCVAPSCTNEISGEEYTRICDPCRKRVDAAMLEARPALLARMVEERTEAEAWLASLWEPKRRWVLVEESEYTPQPIDDVVRVILEDGIHSQLAFVDDDLAARRREFWEKHDLKERPLYGWVIPSGGETMKAWRAHLTPILKAALEGALRTFPRVYAGKEIKDALIGDLPYDVDDTRNAFDEIWEGTDGPQISEGAKDYLTIQYYPDEDFFCELDDYPNDPRGYVWDKYRVLSDDIMAILDALKQAAMYDAT